MAFSQEARRAIRERARDRCELPSCGEREAPTRRFEHHHKKLKGQGGSSDRNINHPSNGALLHVDCHKWVHDHPQQARELGLIVTKHQQVRAWRPEGVGA